MVKSLELPIGSIVVIDDTYNANPASMRAAFANLNSKKTQGRKILILGDMGELGSKSSIFHADLAGEIQKTKIDLVFTACKYMINLFNVLEPKCRGLHAKNSKSLSIEVIKYLKPHDTILIKGSRSSRMEIIIDELVNQGSNIA